jgi:hypothetical protein
VDVVDVQLVVVDEPFFSCDFEVDILTAVVVVAGTEADLTDVVVIGGEE